MTTIGASTKWGRVHMDFPDGMEPEDRARLFDAMAKIEREPKPSLDFGDLRRKGPRTGRQRWPKDSVAEIERLRWALEKIANCGQSAEPDHWKFRQMARAVALAALSKTDAAN